MWGMNRSITDNIARILRTDKRALYRLEDRLSVVTGKKDVFEKIYAENQALVKDRLQKLDLSQGATAKDIFIALTKKVQNHADALSAIFQGATCDSQSSCNTILDVLRGVTAKRKGFFLKADVAKQLLKQEPPQTVMEYLGYTSVDEMIAKENLLEIYSALRFLEGSDWLNKVFFKQYEKLTPKDFEEREVVVHVLDGKWVKVAKNFVMKKWHNISHLKEIGVVFVIPFSLGIPGELLRMYSLILHYMNEIPFYSDIFRMIAKKPRTFAENFISLLRGDVYDKRPVNEKKATLLVIQRYLAKDDEYDWRLFVPHIDPEALHWLKGEENVIALTDSVAGLKNLDLKFWHNLDWVGDYFKDDAGNDVLVSFNLVDTVMSLVKEKEMIKYLYHHQEALWNKIFIEYFSREELEQASKEHLLKGYFEI
ncbi:MAG: hypothetical protein Q8R26_01645 [bacterium]|nr:hypothetical protein [bacterium]